VSKRFQHNKLPIQTSILGSSENQTKTDLATAINVAISELRLSQAQAADVLGIPQPKISALANYRLDGFSVQRLFKLLNALGRDVVIQVGKRKEAQSKGKTSVRAA